VAFVGFGLVGGSLARDLRGLSRPPAITAVSARHREVEDGVAAGILDAAPGDLEGILREADLVVYATPVGTTLRLLEEHRGLWRPGAVITDVGSLKAPVLEAVEELGEGVRYVGSHPMAGGEGSGFGASRQGVFRDARVWLVAGKARPQVRRRVWDLWEAVGGRPAWIDPLEHDRRMVWASHLPQLAANALALALEGAGLHPGDLGPGGRDMTRLAASGPEMWQDLFRHAPGDLLAALEGLEGEVGRLRRLLEEERWEEVARAMKRTGNWKKKTPRRGTP
jgi:prephenate dehydrogenase